MRDVCNFERRIAGRGGGWEGALLEGGQCVCPKEEERPCIVLNGGGAG